MEIIYNNGNAYHKMQIKNKEVKMKKLFFAIIAIAVLIVPVMVSPAYAQDIPVWGTNATANVSEPIIVQSVVVTAGTTYTQANTGNTWTIPVLGSGQVTMQLTAENTSGNPYTVYMGVSGITNAGITAVWDSTSFAIPAHSTHLFTCTVIISNAVPVGSYTFNLNMMR